MAPAVLLAGIARDHWHNTHACKGLESLLVDYIMMQQFYKLILSPLIAASNFCSLQMMRVELVKYNKRYGFAKMRGTCHVGPNLVCEADLNLVMGK